MRLPLASTACTLAALVLAASGAAAQVSSPPSGDVDRDVLRSEPRSGYGADTAAGGVPERSIVEYLVRPDAEAPEDGAKRVVTRASLEPAVEGRVRFEELPGGVVLGRVPAAPPELVELAGAGALALAVDPEGTLELCAADGRAWSLAAAEPSLVTAALAFASRESAAEWLVDLDADGTVHLAPELVDTEAGLVAVRADLVPSAFAPALETTKTVLVDDAVRMRLEPGALVLEADLELRAYERSTWTGNEAGAVRRRTALFRARTGAGGTPLLAGPEGEGHAAMAAHLGDLSRLAGWVGFFRWARAAGVAGLEGLPALLPSDPAAHRTPARVAEQERMEWILRGHAVPRQAVPDWMRRHRARAERAGSGER